MKGAVGTSLERTGAFNAPVVARPYGSTATQIAGVKR
jgi:hypothetical protein